MPVVRANDLKPHSSTTDCRHPSFLRSSRISRHNVSGRWTMVSSFKEAHQPPSGTQLTQHGWKPSAMGTSWARTVFWRHGSKGIDFPPQLSAPPGTSTSTHGDAPFDLPGCAYALRGAMAEQQASPCLSVWRLVNCFGPDRNMLGTRCVCFFAVWTSPAGQLRESHIAPYARI